MDDSELLHTITKLVDEEHQLMQLAGSGDLDEIKHARMREIEIKLDQCWDLLRQTKLRYAMKRLLNITSSNEREGVARDGAGSCKADKSAPTSTFTP